MNMEKIEAEGKRKTRKMALEVGREMRMDCVCKKQRPVANKICLLQWQFLALLNCIKWVYNNNTKWNEWVSSIINFNAYNKSMNCLFAYSVDEWMSNWHRSIEIHSRRETKTMKMHGAAGKKSRQREKEWTQESWWKVKITPRVFKFDCWCMFCLKSSVDSLSPRGQIKLQKCGSDTKTSHF